MIGSSNGQKPNRFTQMRKQRRINLQNRIFWSLAGLLCILIIGCQIEKIIPEFFSGPKSVTGIIFSHEKHMERGFSCALCHQFFSQKEPDRPPERICRFCHEIGEHEKPTASCGQCHARKDFSIQPPVMKSFSDSKFFHEIHLKKAVACEECHGDLNTAESYQEIEFPMMNDCLSCHEKRGADDSCQICHRVQRQDRKPESHERLWIKNHGRQSVDTYETNCAYCHKNKVFCQECHMARPPDSHTLFFKNRGHGFQAETDRFECLPCHQQDFCLRCHGPEGEVMPPSHKGGFLLRPYLHCARCHFPDGAAAGCRPCHRSELIQIKHLEATEIESNPIPDFVPETSLNCLNACHPFDQVPPPHPLGGLLNNDCIRCHMPIGGF